MNNATNNYRALGRATAAEELERMRRGAPEVKDKAWRDRQLPAAGARLAANGANEAQIVAYYHGFCEVMIAESDELRKTASLRA